MILVQKAFITSAGEVRMSRHMVVTKEPVMVFLQDCRVVPHDCGLDANEFMKTIRFHCFVSDTSARLVEYKTRSNDETASLQRIEGPTRMFRLTRSHRRRWIGVQPISSDFLVVALAMSP